MRFLGTCRRRCRGHAELLCWYHRRSGGLARTVRPLLPLVLVASSQEGLRRWVEFTQFNSFDWQDFLRTHNLVPSMSRRGNCHDNAVAESYFQLLKRERVRRRTYPDRESARRDVFDYIEMFYNPKRRHGYNNRLTPVEYEKQFSERLQSV